MINKVGFFRHTPSGCFWYRIKNPMDMFKANGIGTEFIELDKDINDFDNIKTFQFYGAVPFSFEKIFEFLKKENKKIIYDADDALDYIDESNPFYFSVKKDLGSANMAIEYADELTVSTPEMKKYMETKTSKPITVVPNCYVPSEWAFPRPKREGIRIGFAGSATHVQDLIDIVPIIRKLQTKYPITFIIMGFGMSDYKSWYKDFRYTAPLLAQKQLEELDKALEGMEFEWVSYVDYDKYPSSLINMALDIGLCPLKDTPFNRCRSACKAMEYTLAGAVALASDVAPYRNEATSVLVKDGDWEDAIELMCKHPDVRKNFNDAARTWLEENRKVDSQLVTLKRVYDIM